MKTNVDDAPDTQLVCGRLRFDHADQNLVLSALPETIVVSADKDSSASHIQRLIAHVREELDAARHGAAAIASDLASALLLIVVRAYLEAERQPGSILSLLSHPTTARAVTAMLKSPGRAWTLDELAEISNTSRASLVRMFRQTAKISPLAFLATTRLELARRKLQGPRISLATVAAEVGYQSESAFSRAFQLRYVSGPARRADNSDPTHARFQKLRCDALRESSLRESSNWVGCGPSDFEKQEASAYCISRRLDVKREGSPIIILTLRRDTASACGRKAELHSEAYHQFRLTVCNEMLGDWMR